MPRTRMRTGHVKDKDETNLLAPRRRFSRTKEEDKDWPS